MKRHRIMVIGSNVTTVQRISRYCLAQGAEVFPYYGIPTVEEIALFAPQLWVLCLPLPKDFRHQLREPYILWSEQPMDVGLKLVSTPTELEARLQEFSRRDVLPNLPSTARMGLLNLTTKKFPVLTGIT